MPIRGRPRDNLTQGHCESPGTGPFFGEKSQFSGQTAVRKHGPVPFASGLYSSPGKTPRQFDAGPLRAYHRHKGAVSPPFLPRQRFLIRVNNMQIRRCSSAWVPFCLVARIRRAAILAAVAGLSWGGLAGTAACQEEKPASETARKKRQRGGKNPLRPKTSSYRPAMASNWR